MIFVDSSFWIAQALGRDRHHVKARRLTAAHATSPLVTSNLIVTETWTYLRRRTWRVRDLLARHVVGAPVSTHRIDEELEDEAWAWLHLYDERPYSFVDATSFARMRKMRITDALAFDGDFAAAGFTELRAH